jgi:outer membrane protein assembly factor BamE (lipoprotein component of BamABCDE complex)
MIEEPALDWNRSRKTAIACILALVVFAVLVVMACRGILASFDQFDKAPFERALWLKSGRPNSTNSRRGMANDVIEHQLRVGTTRQQVLDQLGHPDQQAAGAGLKLYISEGSTGIQEMFRYYLGDDNIGMDSLHLYVYFDANQRVKEVMVGE